MRVLVVTRDTKVAGIALLAATHQGRKLRLRVRVGQCVVHPLELGSASLAQVGTMRRFLLPGQPGNVAPAPLDRRGRGREVALARLAREQERQGREGTEEPTVEHRTPPCHEPRHPQARVVERRHPTAGLLHRASRLTPRLGLARDDDGSQLLRGCPRCPKPRAGLDGLVEAGPVSLRRRRGHGPTLPSPLAPRATGKGSRARHHATAAPSSSVACFRDASKAAPQSLAAGKRMDREALTRPPSRPFGPRTNPATACAAEAP